MDAATALLIAFGGKEIVTKLLGPTAEYIGGGIQGFTKKRVENVQSIFEAAYRLLGDRVEEDGSVPPRILRRVLDEGSFVSDPLCAEYFGGVLASSRSEVERDDRGLNMISRIEALSTYQVRTHYILYAVVKQVFDGTGLQVSNPNDVPKMGVFIPIEEYIEAMDLSQDEIPLASVLMNEAMFGLDSADLIGSSSWRYSARKEDLVGVFKDAPCGGIVFSPSAMGVTLMLWAYGLGNIHNARYLTDAVNFDLIPTVKLPKNAIAIHSTVT